MNSWEHNYKTEFNHKMHFFSLMVYTIIIHYTELPSIMQVAYVCMCTYKGIDIVYIQSQLEYPLMRLIRGN